MTERSACTLVDVLRHRAAEEGGRPAYTFLVDGEGESRSCTYGELETRARRIAVALADRDAAGRPAMLVCEPGLDFIAAVFGCFFAGVPAVPVFPPEPRDVTGGLERLRRIAADAGAATVLTTSTLQAWLASARPSEADARPEAWCAVDALPIGSENAWCDPHLDRERLAFLQYTSGSTGDPRGVMVTHGNLLAHGAAVRTALSLTCDAVVASWLPLYHDMGLVGTVLIPMQVGFPAVLMSPWAFLARPVRWLEAIARHGATLSPAPNFAYELVVRRSTPAERRRLDLSRWQVALNGAEPVRPGACERFVEAFAPCGFRREALVPCYGLAEATLMVAGGPPGTDPMTLVVDGDALTRNRVVPTAAGAPGARVVMGCGRVVPGLALAVVDPEAGRPLAPGTIGEIWVAGAAIASGYWRREGETSVAFGARLADDARGPFLRTGDLGFVHDGVVFVTGRRKDLLVVRGRNYYPQDLEHTAAGAHPALRPGGGAAFAIDEDGDARIAIVQETNALDGPTLEAATIAVRDAVAREHGLRPHTVALIHPRTLPKTSSGKVQRRACRDALAAGRLRMVAAWFADDDQDEGVRTSAPMPTAAEIEMWLVQAVARVREVTPDRIRADDPWVVVGIDSAEAAEVGADLSDWLGRAVPLRMLMQHKTLRSLASALHEVPR